MPDAEGDESVAGQQSENQVAAFVKNGLQVRSYIHYKHCFRKHEQKRGGAFCKCAENVHAENYKNAAGRSGKEHDYFGDNVAGLCFFLQNFATLNILYYIIQQNPPQNKAVLLTYYKKYFGEGACGASGD